ncbi:MAG: hypothetical protein PQJ47_02120 [Sphaerochaetaceae bacterium]|nr:hypothetical protein [Sphaerochaetaceae bacterium]
MVHRRLTIFLFVLIFPALFLFSSNTSVGFGSVSEFQVDFGSPSIRTVDIVDVTNWATGWELRLRAFMFSLDGYMLVQQGEITDVTDDGKPVYTDDYAQIISGMMALSIGTEVAQNTRLSLGIGSLYGINIHSNWSPEFWISSEDNIVGVTPSEDFWEAVSVAYRARLDFNFYRFTVGLFVTVPSEKGSLDTMTPDWESGKIGAAFITTLF